MENQLPRADLNHRVADLGQQAVDVRKAAAVALGALVIPPGIGVDVVADDHSIGDTFPKGFKDLAQVFDLYCEHYIAKYNELVDKIFELLHYDDLQKQKEKFKIMKRHSGKAAIEDEVF